MRLTQNTQVAFLLRNRCFQTFLKADFCKQNFFLLALPHRAVSRCVGRELTGAHSCFLPREEGGKGVL